MKLFVDTNFLIDFSSVDRPEHETAMALGRMVALESDEEDFEDGIIRAVAENWGADYLVTRDEAGFKKSRIPKIEPSEFVV